MNKVITINLNGRAYQLEEAGYDDLRRYLDQAAAKLGENPDKDEIMADFEQAIADKCEARLSPRKNVITATEISEIINAMGPVDTGTSAQGSPNSEAQAANGTANTTDANATKQNPKRLYRIPHGEWLAGVCNGLAAYFGIDVTVMRVIFVLLGVITHGFWILAYVLLIIIMPIARTEDELAAARGTKPFNAHDFIEQAKARYSEFENEFSNHANTPMPETPSGNAGRDEWRKWKEDMKQWKHELKNNMHRERDMRREAHREAVRSRHDAHRAWREERYGEAGMGFFRFLMGVILAGLFVLWAFGLWDILKHGMFFGFAIAAGHPVWVSIVFVCALFYALSIPFKFLMHGAQPWHWKNYNPFIDIVESLFFIFAIYLLVWTGRELFPAVNTAYLTVVDYVRTVWPWK